MDLGLPVATIAVNISAIEFRPENFLERVFEILDETGLDPKLLELELTESVMMKPAESTESIFKALRSRGVQLAMDDFGTGYSSLSYLRRFPMDALKIDRSFVRQIATGPQQAAIRCRGSSERCLGRVEVEVDVRIDPTLLCRKDATRWRFAGWRRVCLRDHRLVRQAKPSAPIRSHG